MYRIRSIVNYSIYLVILAIMAFTPQIGFIQVGVIKISTMLIPIAICTVHLRYKGAIFSCSLFGLFSFLIGMFVYPSYLFYGKLNQNVGLWFINAFLTRFLMGLMLVITIYILQKIKFKKQKASYNIFRQKSFYELLVVSIIGQICNSVFFVSTYLWLSKSSFDLIVALISVNTLVEWIIVILIPFVGSPIINILNKQNKERYWNGTKHT